jgi:hypothetical protein
VNTVFGLEAAALVRPAVLPVRIRQCHLRPADRQRPGRADLLRHGQRHAQRRPHRCTSRATACSVRAKVGDTGLWELTARYDTIENDDIANREATAGSLGMNYYLNSNMRFMFKLHQRRQRVTGDGTSQIALRAQFAF